MTAEIIAKLKTAGLTDAEIESMKGADSSNEIATLKRQLDEAERKASGILGDKKKKQQEAEELRARLEELEGKGLGEVEKTKLELERLKSKYEAESKARTELETTYKTERRKAELAKLEKRIGEFLDTVPEDIRQLTIENNFKDIEDLGNTVAVDERLKSVSQKYAGLLKANVPSGAGTKTGRQTTTGNRPIDVSTVSLKEVSKDPAAFLKTALAQVG